MNLLAFTFDINLSSLLSLLIGIGCGVVLTCLIATLITITNIKKDNIIVDSIRDDVPIEEVQDDINKVKE